MPLPEGVENFCAALNAVPASVEGWFTPHIWKGERRAKSAWGGAHGIAIDVDYLNPQHAVVPENIRAQVSPDSFGANIFYWTPRGFRLIYLFSAPWTHSKKAWDEMALNLPIVLPEVSQGRFELDGKVTLDGGRLLYTPNAIVGGVPRQYTAFVTNHTAYDFDTLAFRSSVVQQLADTWNEKHVSACDDWPTSGGECPACGHNQCFGRIEDRWFCFSANHTEDSQGCGVPSETGVWGSALDLEAHRRGVARVEVLDADGYFVEAKKILAEGTQQAKTKAEAEILDDPLFQAMLENIVHIKDTNNVIDVRSVNIYNTDAARNSYPRFFKTWQTHPDRREVFMKDIVFSPEGCSPGQINLFKGLATAPEPGQCGKIVGHVYNMCDYDVALAHHLLCWLAWPLQNPGAKMGYAVVVHGGQGTGKSLFFEQLMMRLYGLNNAIQIGQTELESSFTGWLSQRLYVVCNEVSSGMQEKKQARNRLKSLITDTHFAIDEKYMPLRTEENHANLVFLSNEHLPVLPEMDDRRYEIIRFDRKETPEYYDALADEIKNGGPSAFYQFLLDYDTTGYKGVSEKPMVTFAKEVLVATSRTPQEQFLVEWKAGDTQYPYVCCGVEDLWLAYRLWCREAGYFTGTKNSFGRTLTLSPLGRDLDTSTTVVDGKNTRFRRISGAENTYAEQIRLFREEYNNAYVNYRTRLQI